MPAKAVRGYAVGCKKVVPIIKDISIKKRLLPNGNIVTIICGKSKNCGVVCTIVENKKPKPCKSGLKRTSKSGACRR